MLQETMLELIRERDFYRARAEQAETRAYDHAEAGNHGAHSYHLNEARNFHTLANDVMLELDND